MKVVKQPAVSIIEEAEYYCDKHPERRCYSRLETLSWYGSDYDLMSAEVHLCDECLKEMYSLIKEKFGVEPKELDI